MAKAAVCIQGCSVVNVGKIQVSFTVHVDDGTTPSFDGNAIINFSLSKAQMETGAKTRVIHLIELIGGPTLTAADIIIFGLN